MFVKKLHNAILPVLIISGHVVPSVIGLRRHANARAKDLLFPFGNLGDTSLKKTPELYWDKDESTNLWDRDFVHPRMRQVFEITRKEKIGKRRYSIELKNFLDRGIASAIDKNLTVTARAKVATLHSRVEFTRSTKNGTKKYYLIQRHVKGTNPFGHYTWRIVADANSTDVLFTIQRPKRVQNALCLLKGNCKVKWVIYKGRRKRQKNGLLVGIVDQDKDEPGLKFYRDVGGDGELPENLVGNIVYKEKDGQDKSFEVIVKPAEDAALMLVSFIGIDITDAAYSPISVQPAPGRSPTMIDSSDEEDNSEGMLKDVIRHLEAAYIPSDTPAVASDLRWKALVDGVDAFAATLVEVSGSKAIGRYLTDNTNKLRASSTAEHHLEYRPWLLASMDYSKYKEDSAFIGNRWLSRYMDFFVEMFDNLQKGKDSKSAVDDALDKTLYKHLGVWKRSGVRAVMRRMPSRGETIAVLQGDNGDDVFQEIARFVELGRPIVKFLTKMDEDAKARLKEARNN